MDALVVGGRYLVVAPIAQGGMGTVYDAIHAKTGRRVALKLIHERLVSHEGGRKRFEREARAAATIESLHVVQILDSGDDETSGMPFIAMEYLQGEDLRSFLKRGILPERLAIAIALQICQGLKKAHENDVVHRDLKPGNIFVARTDDGRRVVKLLDFGIAKLVSEGAGDTTDLTGTTDSVGSPPYMSPEQLRSPRDVDELTDVWSLGVVLYELLSGQTPTTGVEPIGARVYAICHKPAPPLRERAPHVSPKLAAVVHRALEIDTKKRFPSIDEMSAALRAAGPAAAAADILEDDIAAIGASDGSNPSAPVASVAAGSDPPARPRAYIWWFAAAIAVASLALLAVAWRATPLTTSSPPPVIEAVPISEPTVPPATSVSSSPSTAAAALPAQIPVGTRTTPPASSTKGFAGGKSAKPRPPAPTGDGREEL